MGKNNDTDTLGVNLISKKTTIKGDIYCEEDIRIEGTIEGSVSTKSKLVIGTDGKIEGEVDCVNADVSGLLRAELHSKELLHLRSTAVVIGNIKVGKLAIEPGAKFSGNCSMEVSSYEKKNSINAEKKESV